MNIANAIQAVLDNIESLDDQHYPVFVPSRHRADIATTPDLLAASGVPYHLVVEPHDADAYVERYGAERVLVMDKNDQGIAYARNWLMDRARAAGMEYVWQLDDDMRRFGVRRNGKRVMIPARAALAYMELLVDSFDNIGGANVMNGAYAFSYDNKPALSTNGMVYCVQLLRTNVAPRFRGHLMDDTDYSMQLLTQGYCTLVSRRVVHEQPSTSVQAGGCTDTTHTHRRERAEAMMRAWPGCFRTKESKEGVRLTVANPSRSVWSSFPQRPALKANAPLARWATDTR